MASDSLLLLCVGPSRRGRGLCVLVLVGEGVASVASNEKGSENVSHKMHPPLEKFKRTRRYFSWHRFSHI